MIFRFICIHFAVLSLIFFNLAFSHRISALLYRFSVSIFLYVCRVVVVVFFSCSEHFIFVACLVALCWTLCLLYLRLQASRYYIQKKKWEAKSIKKHRKWNLNKLLISRFDESLSVWFHWASVSRSVQWEFGCLFICLVCLSHIAIAFVVYISLFLCFVLFCVRKSIFCKKISLCVCAWSVFFLSTKCWNHYRASFPLYCANVWFDPMATQL